LVGGDGSPSGVQGEREPGLRGFNGRFHELDDIWELDLAENRWNCLLPLGHLNPFRISAASYHPQVRGLVIFEGRRTFADHNGLALVWLFRPGIDRRPVLLPSEGDVPELNGLVSYVLDPANQELLLFSGDGIFRVTITGG
jgi:hypothetical protein